MFCKWCGNTIKTTDSKCPSCGRETPAMSDCGGFYDLKHTLESSTLAPPAPPTPLKPTKNSFIKITFVIVAIALFVAVTFGYWRTNSRLNDLETLINDLLDESINEESDTSAAPSDEPSDEASKEQGNNSATPKPNETSKEETSQPGEVSKPTEESRVEEISKNEENSTENNGEENPPEN